MQANRRQNRLPHQHRAGEHPRVICHLSRRGEPSGSAQDVFRLGRRVFAPAPQAVFSPSIPQRRGVARGFSLPFFETFCIFLFRYYEMFCPIPWKGRFRLGSLVGTLPAGGFFLLPERNQRPLRAFPPKDPPWGTRLELRQAGVRPVTLAVAPVCATTPGHPGQLALWPGDFHLRACPGEAAFPPPGARPSAAGNSCFTRVRPWG